MSVLLFVKKMFYSFNYSSSSLLSSLIGLLFGITTIVELTYGTTVHMTHCNRDKETESVIMKVFNGNDGVCWVKKQSRTVNPFESQSFECNGNGKKM